MCHLFTAWIMYSEAKSTPVPPSGQRATSVTFDPHRPVCPRSPPFKDDIEHQISVIKHTHTHTVTLNEHFKHSEQLSTGTQLFSLTFFLQEGFSGGQRTLTHFWVLEKFHSGVHLGWEECNFSLVKLLRRQREKEKKTGSFQIETN